MKAQTTELMDLLILVVGVSILFFITYFFSSSRSQESMAMVSAQYQYERVVEAVRNFFYIKIPKFDKTYGQMLGDMIVNGGEDIVNYGEKYGGINVTKLIYEYFDFHFQDKWNLNLTAKTEVFHVLWIPNSDSGNSVSKVSILDGRELGRYYTVPKGKNGNPSRVSIDKEGNVWVGNRGTRTLVKIGLKENGQCVDRNGDGKIETSEDLNNNGIIDDNEVLPFGEDECLLAEVFLGGNDYGNFGAEGVRAVCFSEKENVVYVGLYREKKFFKVSIDGKILDEWDLAQLWVNPYGCFVDKDGIVWISAVNQKKLLGFNPSTEIFKPIDIGYMVYGIAPCYSEDCIVINSWTDSRLIKLNTTTGSVIFNLEKPELRKGRGVMVDGEENIYAVSSEKDLIVKYDKDGNELDRSKTCREPTGVGIDILGKIWVTCLNTEIQRFDRNLKLEISNKFGSGHYVYNFFTSYNTPPITTGKSVEFGYKPKPTDRITTFFAPIPIPSWRGEIIYLHLKVW
ncbi:MAG: hypothetical protein QW040_00385 [Candidatus Aenigmatarchaeota archaeon]